jgi:hypothetical protein
MRLRRSPLNRYVHRVPAGGSTRLEVSAWELLGEEPDGLSEHPWLLRPGDEQPWLYKPVEIKAGNRQGEDWAEKVVSEIGGLLGVPCAAIELAVRAEHDGLVSRDVKPRGWDLQPGAALLDGLVEGYESRTKFRAGHTPANIQRALRDMRPPPDRAELDHLDAFDVFCGYLVLDALVANRDRHDHNWAVLIPPTPERPCLAASFDHASSLGFNLRDDARRQLLMEDGIAKWARGGTAWRFEHQPPMSSVVTLVDLAVRSLDHASADARATWQEAVRRVEVVEIIPIVRATLGMSEIAGTFALELLTINRRRLLDAWGLGKDE